MRARLPAPDWQNALGSWLDSLPAPKLEVTDEEAVTRGAAVFHSPDVGCNECHAGSDFSSSKLYDVGTNTRFQLKAPTLLGVALRGPLMHNGCAPTLRDRFNPECGGDQHGKVAQLDEVQLSDLIAYVDSL